MFTQKVINGIHYEIHSAYESMRQKKKRDGSTLYYGIDHLCLKYIGVIEKIVESYFNSEEIAKEVKLVFEHYITTLSPETKISKV